MTEDRELLVVPVSASFCVLSAVLCFFFKSLSDFSPISAPAEAPMESYWSTVYDWFWEHAMSAEQRDQNDRKTMWLQVSLHHYLSKETRLVWSFFDTNDTNQKLTRMRVWTRLSPVASCFLSSGSWSTSWDLDRSEKEIEMFHLDIDSHSECSAEENIQSCLEKGFSCSKTTYSVYFCLYPKEKLGNWVASFRFHFHQFIQLFRDLDPVYLENKDQSFTIQGLQYIYITIYILLNYSQIWTMNLI